MVDHAGVVNPFSSLDVFAVSGGILLYFDVCCSRLSPSVFIAVFEVVLLVEDGISRLAWYPLAPFDFSKVVLEQLNVVIYANLLSWGLA
jgi:hypothetical protein